VGFVDVAADSFDPTVFVPFAAVVVFFPVLFFVGVISLGVSFVMVSILLRMHVGAGVFAYRSRELTP
jgi:hypothetical protein